ncbi:SDR family oxidoreductase [Pedobacter antarcticus]|uniref:Short-chain dehydrogenase n=2 Tax=Pedobacter antarcticus TaxID=34086 RepID=A0A081PH76_9SPHI|nr:SDR family oxidoreductase [Pedobacter antarcticus]KEQ30049.1 short-chain dehydrogenase [Pedobacter antarcticus 4BY]SDM68405.1 Short-chain dehydrogenase [Pedobacter antarcticus]SFF39687.1 Short-chain dehydrogenase [Pedobacter antarcticus]
MNIVLTGASSGIGFEAALEFTLQSANKVVCIARSADKLRKLLEIAKSITPDCTLLPVEFDIVNDDYAALVPFLKERLGHVDILINNAGALINKPFLETSADDLHDMFRSNVTGHFKMIQNLLPLMKSGGHILNIGSMGGFQGSVKFPGLAAYSSSKSALHTLTECLAFELAETGIKINCLALGSAQTEMLEQAFPGYQSPVMAFEMGKYVADFARTGHRFFNGKIIPVAVTTP